MFVRINSTNYRTIKNISFAPEIDITCTSIPINQFVVEIYTQETIGVGQFASLYDDLNNLWARYWIISVERVDENIQRVIAQSLLRVLDDYEVVAVMYNNKPVAEAISELFISALQNAYTIDEAFDNMTLSGFCPRQTAKERLQWICFIIGANVKTFFSNKIEIVALEHSSTVIPKNQTYWKPSITYRDYITSVEITSYSFTQTAKEQILSTDDWVTDGTNYYVVAKTTYSLYNQNIPQGTPSNPVSISDVMLVNSSNFNAILLRLASLYFNRNGFDGSVINNATYEPSQRVKVYADDETIVTGYIESCDFSFGLQAMSRVSLNAILIEDIDKLIVTYMYQSTILGKDTYGFPVGYTYHLPNPYLDIYYDIHRYVYYPVAPFTDGTMQEGTNTETVNYGVALIFDTNTNILQIYSVAGVAWKDESEEVVVIE